MLAVRAGDLGAFEHLVKRNQQAAWSTAYRFLGDAAAAEDICQEAFLRVLEAASRYRPEAAFRTYLQRIVGRLCLDHARKKKPIFTAFLPDVADRSPSPQDLLTDSEDRHDIQTALDQLPPTQRLAVIWKYYEGLSYAEIAQALNTTTKAVEGLLARGREALARLLGHLLEQ